MAARLSLKDQLAELAQPAPIDLDPEDALAANDPHSEEHRLSAIDDPSAREHYIDVAPSAIRKLHDSVNDPKYDGVRTSRKQLYDDSDRVSDPKHEHDDEDMSENEEDAEDISHSEGETDEDEELHSPAEHDEQDDEGASDQESGSGSEDEHDQPSSPRTTSQKHLNEASAGLSRIDINQDQQENDIASNLRKTHEADKRKGKAVSRQITLWDTLLDARIQLHKAVTTANRLPLPAEVTQYASHPSAREALDSFLDVADSLTEELFSLQEDLLRSNESIEPPARKRRRLDSSSSPSPSSDPLPAYSESFTALSTDASALEASYHPWLVDTLAKWSAKVQAVAPNVLLPDNKGSFLRDGKSPAQVGVVTLIDDIFRADRQKLLDRTRKRKDKHARLGHTRPADASADISAEDDEEKLDPDVFDDTDYYQQLLRDVIAARGGDGAQAGEAPWQIQQRERKAKRKKTVDTKASKGRKLRYEVHAKLQNFMVPVPVVVGEWHEEQIDGLFSSLLQT